MRVEWQEKAKKELQKQLEYCFNKFGCYTTIRIQEKIDKQIRLLAVFPLMGGL